MAAESAIYTHRRPTSPVYIASFLHPHLQHPRTSTNCFIVFSYQVSTSPFVWLFWYIEPQIGPDGDRGAMKAASTIHRGRFTYRLIPPHPDEVEREETRKWRGAREQYWDIRVPVFVFTLYRGPSLCVTMAMLIYIWRYMLNIAGEYF